MSGRRGASLRGADDELGLVAGDAKSMTTYLLSLYKAHGMPNHSDQESITYGVQGVGEITKRVFWLTQSDNCDRIV